MNTNFLQSSAYELADEVTGINDAIESEYNRFAKLDDAANMLRQQADQLTKVLKHNERLIAELANQRQELTAEIEKKQTMIGIWEVTGKQQADRIAELEKDGKVCATCGGLVYDAVLPQTKPLSDEEIYECWEKAGWHKKSCIDEDLKFARAIEAKVRGQ